MINQVTPFVSVIVVTKNEEKNISECLESLIAQDYPKDRYELIIVDGASTDRTQEICQGYPAKLIVAKSSGIAYQRNTGIATAKGRYIAFTDADCIADKMWLRKLIEQIEESNDSVVAVGGPNLVPDADPPFSKVIGYAEQTFLGSGGSPQCYQINQPKYVSSIPNCNILYRKETIATEKYDERLSVGEDLDLNFRLKQKGYKFLYLPNIVVWHHRPDRLMKFARQMFSYGKANARVTRKYKKIIRWYNLPSALAVLSVIFSYPIIRFFHPAVYIYAVAISIYIIALLISTGQVLQRYNSWQSLLNLILLPVQHFTYGLGFLRGLF